MFTVTYVILGSLFDFPKPEFYLFTKCAYNIYLPKVLKEFIKAVHVKIHHKLCVKVTYLSHTENCIFISFYMFHKAIAEDEPYATLCAKNHMKY